MVSPTFVLKIVTVLDLLGAGMIMPQLPNHARSIGANHLLIGIMGALYAGFQLVSGSIIGSLSGQKGRRTLLVLTLSLCGIAYVLLGLTSSIVFFLGLRAFLGFFKYTQLLTKSIAPDYEKDTKQLSALHSNFDTLGAVAMSSGAIIGGYIVEMFPKYGFTIIALTVAAIFAVNSGLIRQLPKEEEKEKPKEDKTAIAVIDSVADSLKASIEPFYKIDWNTHWELFLLRLLITLSMGVYFCNYALYLKMKHFASPVNLGYVTSLIWTIGAFFNTYFIKYVNNFYKDDKDYNIRNYHVFLTVTLSLIGMVLAPNIPVYIIFILPLVVSFTVGRVFTLEVILANGDKTNKGTVVAITNTIRNLTGVVAPLIAGVVGQYVGYLYIIYVCILLAGIGTYRSFKRIPDIVVQINRKKRKGD